MVFSKEDNSAWESSEVMRELEKMAEEVLQGTPPEAYEPIPEESWEEESEEETESEELRECECAPDAPTIYDGKVCAVCGGERKKEEGLAEEMQAAYGYALIGKLEKLASQLAEASKIKAAYRIERTIEELKDLFRGDTKHD
jgi:hypothetical protein